ALTLHLIPMRLAIRFDNFFVRPWRANPFRQPPAHLSRGDGFQLFGGLERNFLEAVPGINIYGCNGLCKGRVETSDAEFTDCAGATGNPSRVLSGRVQLSISCRSE